MGSELTALAHQHQAALKSLSGLLANHTSWFLKGVGRKGLVNARDGEVRMFASQNITFFLSEKSISWAPSCTDFHSISHQQQLAIKE